MIQSASIMINIKLSLFIIISIIYVSVTNIPVNIFRINSEIQNGKVAIVVW
jgi:hypothetical protein